VKHISVPPLVTPRVEGNLSDLPVRSGLARPHHVAFSKPSSGTWVDVTNAEFLADVRTLAKGLMASGVGLGERVAIMSKTRYEWTLADFAVWTAGAVSVPIYETSSAAQISWIVSDAGCAALILETPAHTTTLAGVRGDLPDLRDVWQIDAGGLDDLRAAGREITDEALESRRGQVRRADIATIIYTSGTTGRPKGCQLTHDNFMALTENTVERIQEVVAAEGASTLLFLPLAHVFARFVQVLCVQSGVRMGYNSDIKNLLADFATFQPTFLYEIIWNLALAGFLVWLGARRRIRAPGLFALYVAGYSAFRIFEETLRIDYSKHILGLRLNFWVAGLLCLFGLAWFVAIQKGWRGSPLAGPRAEPTGRPAASASSKPPAPAVTGSAARARAAKAGKPAKGSKPAPSGKTRP